MSGSSIDRNPIYLDHNATTPVAPEVLDAMLPWLRDGFGNPSSAHPEGRRARAALEAARAEVAAAIGASGDEIVFTSGGTEANNLAVFGTARAAPRGRGLVVSAIEHPAILAPAAQLEAEGWSVARVGVTSDGVVDVAALRASVTGDTALVSVMLANNETGAIQPVAEVAGAARGAGARVHSDAAQALGKIPVDVEALGVDLLTVVGHKVYAPKGVGALYVRRGLTLAPLLHGGGQERGLRPGTENVAYAVGLGAACALARRRLEDDAARWTRLRERLFARLAARVPDLARAIDPARCLPNTLSVRFPGARGSGVLAAAPSVAASTGSACHEGGESPSAVLLAMDLAPEDALGAVRLSLGRSTDERAIDRAADALADAYEATQSRA